MKRALITGGSSDIGQAVCVALARAGHDLVVGYFSDHEGAAKAASLVEAEGREAKVVQANLVEASGVEALLEAAGQVDTFVHNAAAGVLRHAAELKPKHLSWCWEVNARAFMLLGGALIDGRMRDGGRIVALSSLGARRAIPMYGAVGPSKAALESMARHLALEAGARGITVNVVAPGMVQTRALAHFPNGDELLDVALRGTPMGRLATPSDVAGVVALLCSPAAAMISGETINVDGGYQAVA